METNETKTQRDILISKLPEAAKLEIDDKISEGLDNIIKMMDDVVSSSLMKNENTSSTAEMFDIRAEMRKDNVQTLYSRDEMLSNSKRRKGSFVVVPRVIKETE